MPGHKAAQAFWRRVIGDYTGGDCVEQAFADEEWQGLLQRFCN